MKKKYMYKNENFEVINNQNLKKKIEKCQIIRKLSTT